MITENGATKRSDICIKSDNKRLTFSGMVILGIKNYESFDLSKWWCTIVVMAVSASHHVTWPNP